MIRNAIFWDIETSPLPESDIAHLLVEFKAPSNYKDPDKIAANLAEQKEAYLSRAALSPLTGRVAAIGYQADGKFSMCASENEGYTIVDFWNLFEQHENAAKRFIGFNIKRFDLPFLVRRSWKLGIRVPLGVRHGRYWGDQFEDLYEYYQLGDYQSSISLNNLSRYFGLGEKAGSGADFATMPPEQQREYLKRDLELTQAVAERMLA